MQQSKGVIVDGEIQDSPEMEVEKKKISYPTAGNISKLSADILLYDLFSVCIL